MRFKLLQKGTTLLKIFFASIFMDLCLAGVFFFNKHIIWPLVIVLAVSEFLIFWTGIILTYSSSVQLGIKTRVWGIVLGWVPVANLVMLFKIINICDMEIKTEKALIERDKDRENDLICKTKYPILLVHGVFFRDSEHLNYWGRIPKELQKNGAVIYYGEHNSADSVENSAKELEQRISKILEESGSEKVNIIAHSKGGLDSRAVINRMGDKIASLTTINTPHRGCEFADYFLSKIPDNAQKAIADKYNTVASELGDKNPDFLSAVYDLTASECKKRNEILKDNPNVYYQSVGSALQKATSGKFPLNFTYNLVKHFDGENDGLVGINSFAWGEKFTLLRNEMTTRGISHADVIDLNRENINGFDVREFYVQLVYDLKKKGF